MKKTALNYIHLSKGHAGGKDQVGLNLLKGFYELGKTKDMTAICFAYSKEVIQRYAPDIKIITIQSRPAENELKRMLNVCIAGTFVIPKIIKEYNIEVIYHLSCNNGLRRLKARSIMIPHDIKAVAHRVLGNVKIPYYKYLLYRLMYFLDFKHADTIIAISDFDKAEMLKYYGKYREKIIRIYNPILVNKLEKDPDNKEKYICALNLQFHHKNIITLIKAFELIKDEIDYKLILIGNVPKRVEYLKEYVREHHLGERISFTGFIDEQELNYLFVNSSLYVNPTLFEGFGMTAVEALISEVPALISDIPANVEVTKGLCEYYGPADDERVLARRILECLSKSCDKTELMDKSKAMADEYNYLNISRQYLELFEKQR